MSQGQGGESFDPSARDLVRLFRDVRNGTLDGPEARRIWESIPDDQKRDAAESVIDAYVVPHLDAVRERAREDRAEGHDAEAAREYYAQMTADEQEEMFYTAIADLVAVLFLVREQPAEGLAELKARLRDPYTVEALLLIFNNDEFIEYIEPGYREKMKDFAAERLRWMGMALVPELYDPEEVRPVYEEFGLDVDALEATAEQREGGG